jgi:hypothetical protein
MTRSILCGLLALVSVGTLGIVPMACQSGGVGDPCTPEDEYDSTFPGFNVVQEFIESRSFQCATRVCLVNHFQGRVSCPFGQAAPKTCNGPDDTSCGDGVKCKEAQVYAPDCRVCDDPNDKSCVPVLCPSELTCDKKNNVCVCTPGGASDYKINGVQYSCSPADKNCAGMGCAYVLKSYLCHTEGNCQSSDATDTKNATKECCIPGSETPVGVAVCGQCEAKSNRNADGAVYCSCRCCPKCCDDPSLSQADKDAGKCEKDKTICGEACDPNFNYCSCPNGFECKGIRPDLGIADKQLTGAYCIKADSAFVSDAQCGAVKGYWDKDCKGTSTSLGSGSM